MGNKGSRAKRHKPTAAEVALAKEVVYFGDANKDGKLSMDEAMAVLKEIDTDGDGNISADELAAAVADLVIAAGGGVDDVTALKAEVAKLNKEIAKLEKNNAKKDKEIAKKDKDAEKTKPLKAELGAVKAELQAMRAGVIPKGVKTFQKAKFYASWRMFSDIFPRTLALEMDGHAQEIMASFERVRVKMLVPLLFDTKNWHPGREAEGGGVHWQWTDYPDLYTGISGGRKHLQNEDGTVFADPGYGGIKYASLRQPMVAAFVKIQAVANKLVAAVQGLNGKVYSLIPAPAAKVDPVDNPSRGQPVPAEFRGEHFRTLEHSPGTLQLCEEAVALIKKHKEAGTLETKLYISEEEAEFRLRYLPSSAASDGSEKNYYRFLHAKMTLHSEAFHARIEACLGALATIKHANIKTMQRSNDKTQADYMDQAKPQLQWCKDILRVTAVAGDHRILEKCLAKLAKDFAIVQVKVRLAEETHDVLAIIEFEEGLLCEVQFSFTSVQLMKVFSHAAYNIARVNLAAEGSLLEMLKIGYTMPMYLAQFKAGYATRSRDEIMLKLAL